MSALIRPAPETPETPVFREVPHNLEAEQALLGAILVNNEAVDRVSGFLKPEHFYDSLHGRIFDTAAKLIMGGKRATPITLKTFFQGDEPVGELSVPQYLGRLAANATTIINAEDYGRTIYDLAVRRQLIEIGETMVNVAYDSPIDAPPSTQKAARQARGEDVTKTLTPEEEDAEAARIAAEGLFEEGAVPEEVEEELEEHGEENKEEESKEGEAKS